jgi:hypothetical protein
MLSEVRCYSKLGKYSYRGVCSRLCSIGLDVICYRICQGQNEIRLSCYTTESSLAIIETVSRKAGLAALITNIECRGIFWNECPPDGRPEWTSYVSQTSPRKARRHYAREKEWRAVIEAQLKFQRRRRVLGVHDGGRIRETIGGC